MTEAIPMVSMVDVSAEMLLVISGTIIINAIGVLAMPTKAGTHSYNYPRCWREPHGGQQVMEEAPKCTICKGANYHSGPKDSTGSSASDR